MAEKIYIIGHKSPDLDSVAAAISYAELKNKLTKTNAYCPVVAGNLNKESKYILAKFGFSAPERLETLAGKKIILVDHNELSQSGDGIEKAEIVEILDHHKLDFRYGEPIKVDIRPWGASCSIVANLYKEKSIEVEKNLAGLMLGAILVDTIITKSPTSTSIDKDIIKDLAQVAQIADWQKFGLEIFKIRSDVSDLSDEEIIKSDFKDFLFKDKKFGIGQVETADLSALAKREKSLLTELVKIRQAGDYHSTILFLTDIIDLGSRVLASSSQLDALGEALGEKFVGNKAYLPGVVSRKKQVTPRLIKKFG